MDGFWKLKGYDSFDGDYYPIPGEYETEDLARDAASAKLAGIKKSQPDEQSGGSGFGSVQDRIYVVKPDGSSYPFFG